MTESASLPAWQQLSVTIDSTAAEPLSEYFMALGALSASLEDAEDQPLFEPGPGEMPLWQRTRVVALFETGCDEALVRAAVTHRFGERVSNWSSEALENRVWERAWMDHFKPMRFGRRLWICPTDFTPPDPLAVNVTLDPGLAFGTGTHPTTALCLEWLDHLDLEGLTLIDYGCGSGILAVSALKLGAQSACGIDIDEQALIASAENAHKNGVEARLSLHLPDEAEVMRADLVIANILAGPLIRLSGEIAGHLKSGGRLALSGLLPDQAESVQEAYLPWIDFEPLHEREGWVLLSGIRR